MTERQNRRDDIVRAALDLFVEHGYTSTSVRQIAEAVGVTEAALYYHFKEGKRELLGAVVEAHLPDMLLIIEDAGKAESLYDLVQRYGRGLARLSDDSDHLQKLRWAIAEFPKFSEDERALVQSKQLMFQEKLKVQVRRFVEDERTADQITWTLMCAAFGYGQLFVNLELSNVAEFSTKLLIDMMAELLSCHFEPDRHLSTSSTEGR